MDEFLALLYLCMAWWSYGYLRYHVLHISHEYTNNVMRFYLQKFVFSMIFGWFLIPVALIVLVFKSFFGRNGE